MALGLRKRGGGVICAGTPLVFYILACLMEVFSLLHIYASPSLGDAYSDPQLTPNLELWVEIFCVPTCFHMRIPKLCLSVLPYPEKRNHSSFVNISPTLIIDTSMERFSRVLQHGNPIIWIYFQKSSKLNFDLFLKSWNHLSFVNISPTLLIVTSMERSSRVLQRGNPKIRIYSQKSSKLNLDFYFDLCWRSEITCTSSISVPASVNISPSSVPPSVSISPKSPALRQYWYTNISMYQLPYW